MTQQVLVVEDDKTIWRGLHQALSGQGYTVSWASSGADALIEVANDPDLVLLDLGLPDADGIDVCRRIRAKQPRTTILILTARSDEIDIVLGLDAGADDYLTKPFRLAELLARIRAHLRRRDPDDGETEIIADEVTIDLLAHRVWVGDHEVDLRPKEFEVLCLLARDVDTAVHRDDIMRIVWDDHWHGHSKTLDQHISSLRKHLGTAGVHIVAVRGVGYRFQPS